MHRIELFAGGLLPYEFIERCPAFTLLKIFSFFCDETGISGDRFMVVGGLIVKSEIIPAIHKNMESYRNKFNMNAELKWSKVSNQKAAEYEALVEYFFSMNNQNLLQFHCIIFDNHTWNHHRYNDGDPDIGMSKIYYQLILHKFCKIHGPVGSCCACLDERLGTTPHEKLRNMVNTTLMRDHKMTHNPLKQIVSKDSKTDDLLQLNDVILGAVGAVRNGKHLLETTRTSKRNLANLVLQKSGLQSFEKNSAASISRFSVWNFQPKPR